MKRLLLMFILILGIGLTSQAQGVIKVQSEESVATINPFSSAPTIESIISNADYVSTNVVCYIHEANPELNNIIVTTTDSAFAKVLSYTYDLKRLEINDKGKYTFTFGNKVSEARIYTNLISVNTSKFSLNRIRYLS